MSRSLGILLPQEGSYTLQGTEEMWIFKALFKDFKEGRH